MSEQETPLPGGEEMPPEAEGKIDKIAEDFLDELHRGRAPDRDAILAAHPEIADPLARRLRFVQMVFGVGVAERQAEDSMPIRLTDNAELCTAWRRRRRPGVSGDSTTEPAHELRCQSTP